MQNLYIFGQTKITAINGVGLWQLAPFTLFEKELFKSGYKVIRRHASTVEEINLLTLNLDSPDILMIRPEWSENKNDVLSLCKRLRDRYPYSKIFMVDPFDQTSSLFFESLPYLNAMIKYQSLLDKNLYLKLNDYVGGVYLNQRMKDEAGIDPSKLTSIVSKVDEGQQQKIVSGNIIVDLSVIRKIQNPLLSYLIGLKKKNIDICAHMSCGKRGEVIWYGEHRIRAADYMKKSLTQFNISVEAEYNGEPRISRRTYKKRWFSSKIMYSPFGWGEMTLRPIEAIASRSMLIMPDMSHLDLFPNIFIPNETYIPVKLDLSDLVEKCQYYIKNDAERIEVANNLRQAFLREFTAEKFIKHMEAIFNL